MTKIEAIYGVGKTVEKGLRRSALELIMFIIMLNMKKNKGTQHNIHEEIHFHSRNRGGDKE